MNDVKWACMRCEYVLNEDELRRVILEGCPKCGCLHMKVIWG